MKRILSICGDPGGAAAVAPVLLQLAHESDIILENLAYHLAPSIFTRQRVPHREISNELSASGIAEAIDRAEPDLLLCGTSLNGWDLERDFLAAATTRAIPSLAVLDFWANYMARFCSAKKSEPILPTQIAVMDEQARAEMITEGFEPERLVVTGQPALDAVKREVACRADFQLPEGCELVVFASQLLNPGVDEAHPDYPGFSKFTVLPALLAALNDFQSRHGRSVTLALRPHPCEVRENFDWLATGAVDVHVVRQGSSRALAGLADLVVGLNSVLLVECCLMGLPVLSLQPELRGRDCLPTNRMGISRAVYERGNIAAAIEELLLDPQARARLSSRAAEWAIPRDATKRVAALAEELMQNRHAVFKS